MVTITPYGGVDEIGGNKILVEDGDSRVFLDFGTSMGYEGNFFSEFLGARSNTDLVDKVTIGALPRLNGIYQRDQMIPTGVETLCKESGHRILDPSSKYFSNISFKSYESYVRENGGPFVQGILLSHAHLDHTGAIGYLSSEIPLYCSSETATLVRAIDDVTSFKSKAIKSSLTKIVLQQRGKFPGAPKLKHEDVHRHVEELYDEQEFEIGSIKVKHISQDHSVPGASSFVLEVDGKRILYTGDIRFHGSNPMTIDEYAAKVGEIDTMICEGTRIESDNILMESDIIESITEKIGKVGGLVFIDFAWKDTTRYNTVLQASIRNDRIFVINARLAYLLKKFGIVFDPEQVKVFIKRKGACFYSPSDYSKYEYGPNVDEIDDEHYLNGITAEDLMKEPGKYVMMLSFFDLGQIFDFADKEGKIPGSFFIRASCSPFCDEMELSEEKMIQWLDKFGIGFEPGETPIPDGCTNEECPKLRDRIAREHVSGHASRSELKELIGKIDPKRLIPVHTENPDAFDEIASELGGTIQVIKPEYGEPIEL